MYATTTCGVCVCVEVKFPRRALLSTVFTRQIRTTETCVKFISLSFYLETRNIFDSGFRTLLDKYAL